MDIVAEGYDAGVRLTESIERDMGQCVSTDAFRFVVVAAPRYLSDEAPGNVPKISWSMIASRRARRPPVRCSRGTSSVAVGAFVCRSRDGDRQRRFSSTLLRRSGLGDGLPVRADGRGEPAAMSPDRGGPRGFSHPRSRASSVFPSRAQSSPALRAFVKMARKLAASISMSVPPHRGEAGSVVFGERGYAASKCRVSSMASCAVPRDAVTCATMLSLTALPPCD